MKSWLKYIIVICIVVVFCSCSSKDGFVNTELGFSFKHCTNNNTSPKAKAGDVIFGQMKIMLNNKKLISSNYGNPDRLFVISKNPKVGSIDEFLMNLHIGDSALMICPADSVSRFLKGVEFKPTDKIWIYLSVSQIISQSDMSEYEQEKIIRDEKEDELLTNYVLAKYDKAEKKQTGLFYINLNEGAGRKAEYGKVVSVRYTVCDTTGKMIDSNIEQDAKKGGIYRENIRYAPFEFILGDDALISGFVQGIALMREGGHAKLVIPSKLAYGDVAYGNIEPNTPLIFDVYLIQVKEQ